MKAYVPVEPGWYAPNITVPNDDFDTKVAEADAKRPNNYDYLLHVYYNNALCYCVDTYYDGDIDDTECYTFGRNVELRHEVGIFSILWNNMPDWVKFVTVDADGSLRFHNQLPMTYRTCWSASDHLATRLKHKQTMEMCSNGITIPIGVDWRTLIEARPDGVFDGSNNAK